MITGKLHHLVTLHNHQEEAEEASAKTQMLVEMEEAREEGAEARNLEALVIQVDLLLPKETMAQAEAEAQTQQEEGAEAIMQPEQMVIIVMVEQVEQELPHQFQEAQKLSLEEAEAVLIEITLVALEELGAEALEAIVLE